MSKYLMGAILGGGWGALATKLTQLTGRGDGYCAILIVLAALLIGILCSQEPSK